MGSRVPNLAHCARPGQEVGPQIEILDYTH
jgi:hypothetical protein